MARSVSYLRNAQEKTYFPIDTSEEGNGWEWENMKECLIEALLARFPSLHEPAKDRWDDNETSILLENDLVEIGISEYCGLVSLSIRSREFGMASWGEPNYYGLGVNWIKRTWKKLEAAIPFQTYYRHATASNGESFYKPNHV